MPKYRHLHIRRLGVASTEFRAVGRGRTKRPTPVENRRDHADRLKLALDEAVVDFDVYRAEQARMRVPLNKRGMTVAIEGRPDTHLVVGNGRTDTRGLKLLNVRRVSRTPAFDFDFDSDLIVQDDAVGTNSGVDTATFFVTRTTLKSLRRNLDRYEVWADNEASNDLDDFIDEDEVDSSKRPHNFWLFESAGSIRLATLHDLWADPIDSLPRKTKRAEWEVLIRRPLQMPFDNALKTLQLAERGKPTQFVETAVRNIVGTPDEIQTLIQSSAAVVELRSASSFLSNYMELDSKFRQDSVQTLLRRIVLPSASAPRIAIFDTGVNRAHPLLSQTLPEDRCYSIRKSWTPADHQGHGTKMAGIAQFGDLNALMNRRGNAQLSTSLESVVVTAPKSDAPVPARDALRRAVDIVEQDVHPRVFCLAQTAKGEAEDGRPSSSAAALDQLAFGDGKNTRLFCTAVGNVHYSPKEPYQVAHYDDRNRRFGIQSPAQGLNALSVGAISLKRQRRDLVAPMGDLSPTARTAQSWRPPHPTKPDIVMEGGNFVRDHGGVFSHPSLEDLVLTTSRDISSSPLALAGETSAATAAAANLAGRLLARYPQFRMETIRGLMIHAAEWTPVIMDHWTDARDSGFSASDAWAKILACYGWGVPNEEKLFESAGNALTMIIEDHITPYEQGPSGIRLKEMKYFKLPWPSDLLRSLGQMEVELRCTLSYFVEPDLHAVSRSRLDRYASHRLKFDVKRFDEGHVAAQRRFNSLAAADDSTAANDGWTVGKLGHRGTVHHDIWKGPAFKLAERDGISVAPVRGWWGDLKRTDSVRFTLIVSIRTPAIEGDIFAESLARTPPNLLVEMPTVVDV